MIGFPLSEDKLEEKRIASLLWQSYPILVSELWDSAEKQSRGACVQTHTNSMAKSTHICVSARVFYSAYFSIMQKNSFVACCLKIPVFPLYIVGKAGKRWKLYSAKPSYLGHRDPRLL